MAALERLEGTTPAAAASVARTDKRWRRGGVACAQFEGLRENLSPTIILMTTAIRNYIEDI